MYLIAKIGDSFLTEIGEYRLTLQWLILPDPNIDIILLLMLSVYSANKVDNKQPYCTSEVNHQK